MRTRSGPGDSKNHCVRDFDAQDLGMKRVVAKFVPRLLLPEQEELPAAVAGDLTHAVTSDAGGTV